MEFLQGTEQAKSIWGRLLLVVMVLSYILACITQESPMPIVSGVVLLLGISVFYYIPLRFLFWVFTGSGEITVRFLLWLPFIFVTLFGVTLIFSDPVTVANFG